MFFSPRLSLSLARVVANELGKRRAENGKNGKKYVELAEIRRFSVTIATILLLGYGSRTRNPRVILVKIREKVKVKVFSQ